MGPTESVDGSNDVCDPSKGPQSRAPSRTSRSEVPKLSPEEYAAAVAAHASRSAGRTLYPGSNYENLACFLKQPVRPADATSPSYLPKQGNFASLVSIGEAGLEPVVRFRDVDDFVRSRKLATAEEAKSALLFLHGFPSPEWLNAIGAMYTVDPEFFQRHLDFRSATGRIDYFPLPSLPSSANNIIRLRLTTLGQWSYSLGKRFQQSQLEALRRKCALSMEEYRKDITLTHPNRIKLGDSIVRAFTVVDGMNFAIEQDVSFYISWKDDDFTIIIWLDGGRPLDEGPAGPWTEQTQHRHDTGIHLYPVIQHHPGMALKSRPESIGPRQRDEHKSNFAQPTSILDVQYGTLSKADQMLASPFYALTELWQLVAYSECQFLNMVDSKLDFETSLAKKQNDGPTLANLVRFQSIIESHAEQIRSSLSCIRQSGGREWQKSPKVPKSEQPGDDVSMSQILHDYEYLQVRAERLATRCQQGMGVLMNNAIIAESEKAIQQTKEVAKLTRLAYFFIPLSFTASLLGMNLRLFGNGSIEWWVWVATSVPIFGLSILLLYIDISRYWTKAVEWVARRT